MFKTQLAPEKIQKYGEAVRVSPCIKFSRYAALFLGITYGFYRSKFLQNRADKFKLTRDARKAARFERERLLKIEADAKGVRELEAALNIKV